MDSIFLALRSPLLREAVARLLTDAGMTVLGEAVDLPGTLAWLQQEPPHQLDWVVIDALFCCEYDDAVTMVRELAGEARIVMLYYETDGNVIRSNHIMASDGILTFNITSEAMIHSLRLIQSGERVVPRELTQAVLDRPAEAEVQGTRNMVRDPATSRFARSKLPSPRETEILRHLLLGDSNKMIARDLGITEATVKVHLKGLLRKISASNRTQAAIWALINGYSVEINSMSPGDAGQTMRKERAARPGTLNNDA